MDDFNKPKVCWNRIAAEKQFALVDEGIFIQDSMHFIIGANLEYLASVLNSKLIQWLLALIIGDAAGGNAGNADNVLNLCIPHSKINEKISDEEIYRIYNLTNEEIKYINLLAPGENNHFEPSENRQFQPNKKSHCHNS